ncbi:hypothetical protein WJX73_001097 [Symbiochloris irregularis]|uniref:MAGE domain-containing protein n=1 Tax=Symbiochloris irregularis TaxID=706552 RepID=A0AAW1P3F6_9CHLO
MAASPSPAWGRSTRSRRSSRMDVDEDEPAERPQRRRLRRRIDDDEGPAAAIATATENGNAPEQPHAYAQAQGNADGAQVSRDPADQRAHFMQCAHAYDEKADGAWETVGRTIISDQEKDALVAQVMRLMLFKQQKTPDLPVKRSELTGLINAGYKDARKRAHLATAVIPEAQHRFMLSLGLEMKEIKLKGNQNQLQASQAPAGASQAGNSGPAIYVLQNPLPDDLRMVCAVPPKPACLNQALAMVLLQLIHHSGGQLYEDEMWRLLESLGVKKGHVHTTFGVKPDAQILEMLQRRYLSEAVGEFVGAEGNPVKAYEIGEVAVDELGGQLQAFDAQIFGDAPQ